MRYAFTTHDHPAAGGRPPSEDDESFELEVDLEEGGHLTLRCGWQTMLELDQLLREWRAQFGPREAKS